MLSDDEKTVVRRLIFSRNGDPGYSASMAMSDDNARNNIRRDAPKWLEDNAGVINDAPIVTSVLAACVALTDSPPESAPDSAS